MAPAPHRIRRLRLQVQAPSASDAFGTRARVREEHWPAIEAELARAFDELAPGGEVVRLARLDVRVRVASTEELATRLPDLVYRQVRDQQTVRRPVRLAAVECRPEDRTSGGVAILVLLSRRQHQILRGAV